MSPFLRAYFSRLGWTGEPDVSIDTLRELHLQHNSAIPFENLDVLLPREIHLDDRALEEKLIVARRGGYCFEQNGLLERVLREIGFNVRSLLGRVVLANPPQMPPRTHRLLLVEVAGERWIADVGFGGQTLTAPINCWPISPSKRRMAAIVWCMKGMNGRCSSTITSTGSRCTISI